MSDTLKLALVLGLIPVLVISIFGFASTFETATLEQATRAGQLLQRTVCGGLALGSLTAMARLATNRPLSLPRN